jgi:2-polyprenyl-3-methyl-5-hydroxy-6-metoxy-1,4-benzoquinol methylase
MKELYNADYYVNYVVNYNDKKFWSGIFQGIADRIIADYNPKTVLDAGCAFGYLVAAFRKRGVQAYGIDISEYAIKRVEDNIKDFCYVGSLAEDFPDGLPKRYDLVTNIEIIEHMLEEEGKMAIANMCKHADTIIFSSTPDGFEDKTHFTVRPIEYWATLFAENEFYRDFLYRATYITPQAVVFKKGRNDIFTIIREYEKVLHIRENEIVELNKKRIFYRAKRKFLRVTRKMLKR